MSLVHTNPLIVTDEAKDEACVLKPRVAKSPENKAPTSLTSPAIYPQDPALEGENLDGENT